MLESIKEFIVLLLTGIMILALYIGSTFAYRYIDQNSPVLIKSVMLIQHN